MRRALIFSGLGLALLAPFGAALALPPVGPIALVIAPPWLDAEAIIHAAGGAIVGPFQSPFAMLAQSDDPDFAQSLLASGIWAVRDGRVIAQLCGTS